VAIITVTFDKHLATWANMVALDVGEAFSDVDSMNRAVQVFGNFGISAVQIEGSNDGAEWATLNDPQGNALVITGAGIFQVLEATKYIRPNALVGVVDLTVILFRG